MDVKQQVHVSMLLENGSFFPSFSELQFPHLYAGFDKWLASQLLPASDLCLPSTSLQSGLRGISEGMPMFSNKDAKLFSQAAGMSLSSFLPFLASNSIYPSSILITKCHRIPVSDRNNRVCWKHRFIYMLEYDTSYQRQIERHSGQ